MECKVINWYKLIVMLNLNELIFWKIHILAGQYQWLDLLIEFFAVYSGYVLIGVVLCLVIFRSSPRKRLMFLEAVASAILSRLVITEIIRAFYHHPRPFAALANVANTINESGWSFPSGHAALYFALATAVWFYNRKFGVVFCGVAIVMGIARVAVGAHWPLDIVGGIVVGIVSAIIVHHFARKSFGKVT